MCSDLVNTPETTEGGLDFSAGDDARVVTLSAVKDLKIHGSRNLDDYIRKSSSGAKISDRIGASQHLGCGRQPAPGTLVVEACTE